jgi:hypothetical protein
MKRFPPFGARFGIEHREGRALRTGTLSCPDNSSPHSTMADARLPPTIARNRGDAHDIDQPVLQPPQLHQRKACDVDDHLASWLGSVGNSTGRSGRDDCNEQVGIVPGTFPSWNINQAIARFRATSCVQPAFLSMVLRSALAQDWLSARAKATSGQVNLTLELCQGVPIPVSPLAEQEQCMKTFQALANSADGMFFDNEAPTILRQSILAAAFRGELAA